MESALKHRFKRIHYSDLPEAVLAQFEKNRRYEPRWARRGWKVYYTIDSTYIQNIKQHWYVASDLPKDFIHYSRLSTEHAQAQIVSQT